MTSSDQVYEELRRAILDGQFKPGSALKERDICASLNVSRTPVREALQRLGSEGLAELRPGRSIIVSKFEQGEIGEIFAVGTMLEGFVAGLAAAKATAQDIAILRQIVATMGALLDSGNEASGYVHLDHAFHDQLSTMARSKRVAQILRQTVSFRLLAKLFQAYEPVDFATSYNQHITILQAIEKKDAVWATAAMQSHIMTGRSISSRDQ